MTKFTVGQQIYYVPNSNSWDNKPRLAKITKVGRKYAYFGEGRYTSYRFPLNSSWVDGGQYSIPGRVYLSKEDYDRKVETGKLRRKLRECLDGSGGAKNYTLEQLKAVNEILNPDEKQV